MATFWGVDCSCVQVCGWGRCRVRLMVDSLKSDITSKVQVTHHWRDQEDDTRHPRSSFHHSVIPQAAAALPPASITNLNDMVTRDIVCAFAMQPIVAQSKKCFGLLHHASQGILNQESRSI